MLSNCYEDATKYSTSQLAEWAFIETFVKPPNPEAVAAPKELASVFATAPDERSALKIYRL